MPTKKILATEDNQLDQIRQAAERDLEVFIRLIAPKQVLGICHQRLCSWWTREGHKSHQLLLWPRDHQKSRMVAYRVAWEITRHPWWRFLYISSTSNLAEKQLKLIKDILTSPIYRKYWPEMVNKEEGKREKWTNSEISVDHPRRKEEGVAEPTIFTGGLTTSLTGFHCEVAICDDLVVFENAYTDEGRNKVRSQYSLLSSIETGEAQEWVVGTRYYAKDLYSEMMKMEVDLYENHEVVGAESLFEIVEEAVEANGDGTGEFLWPKQQRADGRWFGFDENVLAKKRAQYLDRTQFRAQYYNDPNDPDQLRIKRELFQYYDKKFLDRFEGNWYVRGSKINVFASVDFAYSEGKRSDYTAVVVIGIDRDNNIYVLDIDRFKSDRISEYYNHILVLHTKWEFRRLAAEVTAAQAAIVKELKVSYIQPNGLYLSIEEVKPTRHQGSKEERLAAILEPKYENLSMWHYQGGNCQVLEDELVAQYPPHDDVMDALATAIEIAVPPIGNTARAVSNLKRTGNVIYNPKWGGVGF